MPARSELTFTNRLVFLHGFTQIHHHWHAAAHEISNRLTSHSSISFVDLPGHGLSGTDRSDINGCARQLATLAGAGTYVGYSMGGRFGLAAALACPDLVERLVLIGATPGLDDAEEREQRRVADDARAARVEFAGVDTFLSEWMAAPMFANLPDDPIGLRHRRGNSAAGLAHSLRTSGTGSQVSLWGDLTGLEIPVLVVVGEDDHKFSDIGARMTTALPSATLTTIEGAGHAAHLEQPGRTAAAIAEWLD